MNEIKEHYKKRKSEIESRLNEFRRFCREPVSWFFENGRMELREVEKNTNERIFEELVFCILTANTSAAMGMKAVDALREGLIRVNVEEMQRKLKKCGYRFHNVRAKYIVEARENFKKRHGFNFTEILDSEKNVEKLRDFFVGEVKGLGYKEASHFLRNIGIFGFAILDKHILGTLNERGVIDTLPKCLNRKRYLEIEKKFTAFSKKLKIDINHLDLALWSMKTENVMK